MSYSTATLLIVYAGGIIGAWMHKPSIIFTSFIPFAICLGYEVGKELSTPTKE